MTEPIAIAVVGHTNVGKTSLLRTLTRQARFGEVSPRPGTTRHVERIDLRVDGQPAVRFFDTPGMEDAVALQHYLRSLPGEFANPVDRVRAFLAGPEAHAAYEQEAKVLRTLLEVDAAVYVIDCRQDVLPKYRSEIELLCACARPLMPVLNFVARSAERADAWRELLTGFNLHAWMQFDAVAPFVGAERQLFQDLCVLLRPRQAQLQAVVAELERQGAARRTAAATLAARLLVHAAAMRRSVPREVLAPTGGREQALVQFRDRLAQATQKCVQAVLGVYGFRDDEADVALQPWTSGRWQADLFHPQTLQDAGRKLGTGAAVGAAVGAVADVTLAGLSLGAATALGAAVGGVASQGWSQVPRKLMHRLQGTEELSVEDAVLLALADSLVRLIAALERRGHAATQHLQIGAEAAEAGPLQEVVHALSAARGFAPNEAVSLLAAGPDARREALSQRVAALLLQRLGDTLS
jgi:hypothetical protein